MADRYWVSTTGTYTSTASWSATSGGAGGASVPAAGDNAYFDRGSVPILSGFTPGTTAGNRLGMLVVTDGYFGSWDTALVTDAQTVLLAGRGSKYKLQGDATVSLRVESTRPIPDLIELSGSIAGLIEIINGYVLFKSGVTIGNLVVLPRGIVNLESGITLTRLRNSGGQIRTNSSPLTFEQWSGNIEVTENASANLVDFSQHGGNVNYKGQGNIPIFRGIGGTFDISELPYSVEFGGSGTGDMCELWQGYSIMAKIKGSRPTFVNPTYIGRGPIVSSEGDLTGLGGGLGGLAI